MREIKFRVWDKKNKRVIYEEDPLNLSISLFGEIVQVEHHGVVIGNVDTNTKDYEIMQFTGLKDKNGVLIYEGDIIRETYPAGYKNYQVKFGKFDNGEEYEDHEAGLGFYCETVFEHYFVERWKEQAFDKFYEKGKEIVNMVIYDLYANTEVIGNVWENPDLLVNKKS